MAILPFTPRFERALAPGGEVIAGVGNEYRFEVHDPDGGTNVSLDPGADSEYEGGCWRNTYLFDVFDIATGELLGTVPEPEPGFTRPRFIDGDTVLTSVTDALGTVRLKKYRLVVE